MDWNRNLPAEGTVEVAWDLEDGTGRRVSRGLYFVRLGAAAQAQGARIVVTD